MTKTTTGLFVAFGFCLCMISSFAQPFGGMASFDGVNDFGTTTDNLWKRGNKTLEMWVSICPNTGSIQNASVISFFNGQDSLTLSINVNSNGTLGNLQLKDTASTNAYSIPFFSSNSWHHIALTNEPLSNAYIIYFDGDSLGRFNSVFDEADSIVFGKGTSYLGALVDEVHFLDTALYKGNFTKPSSKPDSSNHTVDLFSFSEDQGSTTMTGLKGGKIVGKGGLRTNTAYGISSNGIICKGDSLDLFAAGGTSYTWSPASLVSDSKLDTTAFIGDSTVRMTVQISDTNMCSRIEGVIIQVNENPTPELGNDTVICKDYEVELSSGNYASYLWSNGSINPNINVGKGSHWVRVTDSAGCNGTDSIVISEFPAPTVNLGPDTTVPFGTTFYLDAGSGFVSYQWSTNEKSRRILVSLPIVYRVTVTDSNGCQQSDLISVKFNTVGIGESSFKSFRVYPNPIATGQTLRISSPQIAAETPISLTQIGGRSAFLGFVRDQEIEVPIPDDLAPGIYFLRIGNEIQKVIISPAP